MRKTLSMVSLLATLGLSGCTWGDTYVVRRIAPNLRADDMVAVVCEVPGTEKIRHKRWDPIVQIAPVVGEEWLCN